MATCGEITVILKQWGNDRQGVVDALTPIVYGELRKIAVGSIGQHRQNHTLQPTALIHEAYLRLVKQDLSDLNDRAHFYALAAKMMRQILVDSARAYSAKKRGSGNKVQFNEQIDAGDGKDPMNLLVVHEALEKLQVHHGRAAQAIELKYFGGLTLGEIAENLSVGEATVKRDLVLGEAWLRRALDTSTSGQ